MNSFLLGDAFGAGIVHHLSKRDLAKMDAEEIATSPSHSTQNDMGDKKPEEQIPNLYHGLSAL